MIFLTQRRKGAKTLRFFMWDFMKKALLKFSSFASLRLCVFALIFFFAHSIQAQSTDQNFPTAITANQISGTIKARDVGDSRLTTYFYVFGGEQGDIFINVVTKNFDGDVDVFTLNGLKPLTKIRVFSDSSDNETGRIIYLRQPEKMILRVEGRSPNDEPATFQIKFAGSFVAEKAATKENDSPQVKSENQGEVRVNSVGTIIETKPTPKPIETPKETETVVEKKEEKAEKTEVAEQETKPKATSKKPNYEVVITDNLETPIEEKTEETPKKEVNPLENIKLTVIFKDGTKIERPMSEIINVNVDKGILTIIQKDGTIGRYSLLDVAKMTIE